MGKDKIISEATYKALNIFQDHPTVHAKGFAKFMWPDSDMHKRRSNGGNGSQRGKAAWLAAGSLAGRLKKAGYLTHGWDDVWMMLTDAGKKAIAIYEGTKKREESDADTRELLRKANLK